MNFWNTVNFWGFTAPRRFHASFASRYLSRRIKKWRRCESGVGEGGAELKQPKGETITVFAFNHQIKSDIDSNAICHHFNNKQNLKNHNRNNLLR